MGKGIDTGRYRSYSTTDECFRPRKNSRCSRILSPKTPKTPKTPNNSTKFDFSLKVPQTTNKQRSISMSDEVEKVISFKKACRKYTISTEISEQLAVIGDEILADYEHIFTNFDTTSINKMFRQKKGNPAKSSNRRRKISGYLGLVLLHLVSKI